MFQQLEFGFCRKKVWQLVDDVDLAIAFGVIHSDQHIDDVDGVLPDLSIREVKQKSAQLWWQPFQFHSALILNYLDRDQCAILSRFES